VFFICIISSPPIYLRAVSLYSRFASMKILGSLILGKMNVRFSFESIIALAMASQLGGIFVSLSWNGNSKLYVILEVRQVFIC
jgi:hypothetical protein